MTIKGIVNPSAQEARFVAPVAQELKKTNIGLFQATKLSAQLMAAGAFEVGQSATLSGAKFVGSGLLTLVELSCRLVGKKCQFEKGEWTSHYTAAEARAEASRACKTAVLLAAAFAGPFKPQWVATVGERLGLSQKEGFFRSMATTVWERVLEGQKTSANIISQNKVKTGLAALVLGAIAFDFVSTGYIAGGAQNLWTRLTTDPETVRKLREELDQFRQSSDGAEQCTKDLETCWNEVDSLGRTLVGCSAEKTLYSRDLGLAQGLLKTCQANKDKLLESNRQLTDQLDGLTKQPLPAPAPSLSRGVAA